MSQTIFRAAIALIFLLTSSAYAQTPADRPYTEDWTSLSKHEVAPAWFQDAKLGIYFHWGPYSVPAFNGEWYPRNMFLPNHEARKHHEKTYGPVTEFGYEKFIPMFTAEHFDPDEWAQLFADSGARFAGPVAQHHDGFAMWASDVNPWNAGAMGPKRDILGELFASLRQRDLKTIATFHHARHGQRHANNPDEWNVGYSSHYPYHPDLPTSTTDPQLRKLYGNFETLDEFHGYWLAQVNEVVDKYQPDMIWFDSWLNLIPESYRQKMAAHHLNRAHQDGREAVICHKQADLPTSLSVLDFEQGGRREINAMPWMTDITLSWRGWCYIQGQEYKDAALVIRNMIDVWSKNGVVLLNISPKADGTIPQAQRDVLAEIGAWLKTHGEAVYGTRPFDIFGFGNAKAQEGGHGGQSATTRFSADDVRFTVSKDQRSMYIFFLGKPTPGKKIMLTRLGLQRYPPRSAVEKATHLGTGAEVEWGLDPTRDTFYIVTPQIEMNEIATVFKLHLSDNLSEAVELLVP